jgi:galactitol-specific phosphotransferase system IIB component
LPKILIFMANTVGSKITIQMKIKKALDGRSQRWLAKQMNFSDCTMSLRMTGMIEFSEEELKKISKILKVDLKK